MTFDIIDKLKDTYNQMGYENLASLSEVYTDDVVFIDPFHRVENLTALIRHFESLYQNLRSIHFEYIDEMTTRNNALLTWRMDFSHRSIRKGRIISVTGATHLKFNEKIFYHHDYFDTSTMLFEHLPVIGIILKWIRKRIST